MAQNRVGNNLGLVDKRLATKAGSSTVSLSTPANYADVTALKARLTAISAGYYTATRLNQMSVNDMVYAVRLNDDAGSI